MDELAQGVSRFRRQVFEPNRDLFSDLAGHQQPMVCWIGCSDSRVPAETIIDGGPGTAFVIRTAGNLIPAWSSGLNDPVAASIEFAVKILEIPHIVVCGHSDCGAMKALATRSDVSGLPALNSWLEQVRPLAELTSQLSEPGDRLERLTQTNVAAQIGNLRGYPAVQEALAEDRLEVHGWVFHIGEGEIHSLDERAGVFAPLLGGEQDPSEETGSPQQ